MSGHVFQVHAEQRHKGQFQDTLDQLRLYASVQHKKEIKALKPLFTLLKKPEIPRPVRPTPKEIVMKTESGDEETITTTIDEIDKVIYSEEIKQFVKDTKNLESTTTSLYNIIWGQCSRLMKNRIMAMKDFSTVEEECDITTLLKEIRRIGNQMEQNISIYDALDGAKEAYYAYQKEKVTLQRSI